MGGERGIIKLIDCIFTLIALFRSTLALVLSDSCILQCGSRVGRFEFLGS